MFRGGLPFVPAEMPSAELAEDSLAVAEEVEELSASVEKDRWAAEAPYSRY